MGKAAKLIVKVLVILAPIIGYSAPLCRSLFDPKESGIPKHIIELAERANKKTAPAAELLPLINRAILERLDSLKVRYESYPSLGPFSYRLLEDANTKYGRLAQKINKLHNAVLIVSAEHYSEFHYLGAVKDRRLLLANSRPELFLGLTEIYRNGPVLRSPTVLHELRHLSIGKSLLDFKDSRFYGHATAIVLKLPGFSRFKDVSYANHMGFDEVRTFHTTVRTSLLRLKQLLKQGHRSQVEAQLKESQFQFGMLQEVTASSNIILSALIEFAQSREALDIGFRGAFGRTTAVFDKIDVEGHRLSVQLPLVDADPHLMTHQQKLEVLIGTLHDMKAVYEPLQLEIKEAHTLLGPMFEHGSEISNQTMYNLIDLALPHLSLLPH